MAYFVRSCCGLTGTCSCVPPAPPSISPRRALRAGVQSVRMYEPQAAELLMTLGLSVAEEASPEQGESGSRVVPVEGMQALSAAMSLIGGDSGVSAEVCRLSNNFVCVLRFGV